MTLEAMLIHQKQPSIDKNNYKIYINEIANKYTDTHHTSPKPRNSLSTPLYSPAQRMLPFFFTYPDYDFR